MAAKFAGLLEGVTAEIEKAKVSRDRFVIPPHAPPRAPHASPTPFFSVSATTPFVALTPPAHPPSHPATRRPARPPGL
jgi:hypothetical protein